MYRFGHTVPRFKADNLEYESDDSEDDDVEKWKNIDGFNNYMVSSFGRIKKKVSEKILKSFYDSEGYCRFELYQHDDNGNYIREYVRIHRLVAIAFIKNPENKSFVQHIDNNKTNNHVSNLKFISRSENQKRKCNSSKTSTSSRKTINSFF